MQCHMLLTLADCKINAHSSWSLHFFCYKLIYEPRSLSAAMQCEGAVYPTARALASEYLDSCLGYINFSGQFLSQKHIRVVSLLKNTLQFLQLTPSERRAVSSWFFVRFEALVQLKPSLKTYNKQEERRVRTIV